MSTEKPNGPPPRPKTSLTPQQFDVVENYVHDAWKRWAAHVSMWPGFASLACYAFAAVAMNAPPNRSPSLIAGYVLIGLGIACQIIASLILMLTFTD